MNCDTVDVKPRRMDWSKGYAETWESWEASECPNCGDAVVVNRDECPKCHKENEDGGQGPMMNYFYSLNEENFDGGTIEAARKLAHLPVCLVKLDGGQDSTDEWGLALTGGGMDFSWEICEAYILLGYMPPAHFCRDLPQFAGMKLTAEKRRVLREARASLKCQNAWNNHGMERLRDTKNAMMGRK